eukprot:1180140-Prorocentrum_minimum.AAC.4
MLGEGYRGPCTRGANKKGTSAWVSSVRGALIRDLDATLGETEGHLDGVAGRAVLVEPAVEQRHVQAAAGVAGAHVEGAGGKEQRDACRRVVRVQGCLLQEGIHPVVSHGYISGYISTRLPLEIIRSPSSARYPTIKSRLLLTRSPIHGEGKCRARMDDRFNTKRGLKSRRGFAWNKGERRLVKPLQNTLR